MKGTLMNGRGVGTVETLPGKQTFKTLKLTRDACNPRVTFNRPESLNAITYDFAAYGSVPRGPMGPSRLQLSKPVIAAIAVPAVAGVRACVLVRPARDGRGRVFRRLQPALGNTAQRRRHRAPVTYGRARQGSGFDPHRAQAAAR